MPYVTVQLSRQASKKKVKRAGRGVRTLDLPLTKRLPCHLAIPAVYAIIRVSYQKRVDLIFRARIELATFCV
jgi:hypothetical protein